MASAIMSEDYRKYVLNDLKKYNEVRTPLRAGALERLMVGSQSPLNLHPNPGDEFSMPDIGPSYAIVNNYVKKLTENHGKFDKPLMVEKMFPEGYMILNGHHRWFAAIKTGLKKVPIRIVNLVHEKELKEMMENSNRDKRAVFDLDEVLWLMDDEKDQSQAEKDCGFLFFNRYEKHLRKFAPILLQELNRMGYDIWVYTAGYYSVEYIQKFFQSYHVHIDGIVNGTRRGKKGGNSELSGMRSAFAKKYRETIHIDLEHLTRIRPSDNDFDYITLDTQETNWSVKVLKAVRGFNTHGNR